MNIRMTNEEIPKVRKIDLTFSKIELADDQLMIEDEKERPLIGEFFRSATLHLAGQHVMVVSAEARKSYRGSTSLEDGAYQSSCGVPDLQWFIENRIRPEMVSTKVVPVLCILAPGEREGFPSPEVMADLERFANIATGIRAVEERERSKQG